jgi:hypothetical protein
MVKVVSDLCPNCKEQVWTTKEQQDMLRRSHVTFYCIWGHPQSYTKGPSEEDKLRRERDRLKQEAARLHQRIDEERAEREHAERRISAAKGQITKIKKRSAEGRCPCCNHVFVDLLSHMKSKHADYEAEPIDFDVKPEEAAVA